MSGNRSGKSGSGSGSELTEDQLKAELLARLGRLSYRELLTLTLDMALGARATSNSVEVRDSRPRSALPTVRPAVGEVVDWTKVKATCPKCGKTGRVMPDFGIARRHNGVERAQSYCRECRSKPAVKR